MLALVTLSDGRLAHFEFGTTFDPELDHEARLRRAVGDYAHLEDEVWDVPPHLSPPVLLALLDEHRADPVRLVPVIHALGDLVVERAAAALEPLLEYDSAAVQLATIEALGRIGQFSSMRLLGDRIQHPDRAVRRAVTVALGKFGVPAAAVAALGYAGDDAELATLSRQGLARARAFSAPDSTQMVATVVETDEWRDLRGWFGFLAPELIATARSPRYSDLARARAAAVAMYHRSRLGVVPALELAHSGALDADTRAALATGFGRCRVRPAVPWLLTALADARPVVHEAAIRALGRIGDAAALYPLLALWNARDGALREMITLALRRIAPVMGARALWEVVSTDTDAPAGPAVFVMDSGEVLEVLPRGPLSAMLALRNVEARRDATVLLGVLGGAVEYGTLVSLQQRETDDEMRTILAGLLERLNTRREPVALVPWPASRDVLTAPASAGSRRPPPMSGS